MMKRVVASWNTYYSMFQNEVEKNWDKGPGEIENAVRRIYLTHKADPDCQKAYSRWCEENDCDEDDMEQYDESEILYVIRIVMEISFQLLIRMTMNSGTELHLWKLEVVEGSVL